MTVMIATTIKELAAARAEVAGSSVALVPTMGGLHEGHRSLFRMAHSVADVVVASIFVNPLQFDRADDFARYPRTFDEDVRICAEDDVAVVFTPSEEVMYPGPQLVTVSAGPLGTVLEGAYRPRHFDGVLTVVLKLFNLVRPHIAVFGEKDAQQLAAIRQMVHDLNVPVRILAAPTVREPDGLALSSRNRLLAGEERQTALALSSALAAGRDASSDGPAAVLAAARAVLDQAATVRPPLESDYLALVRPDTFTEVDKDHAGEAVLVVAGRVGSTRLIDNMVIDFGAYSQEGDATKEENRATD